MIELERTFLVKTLPDLSSSEKVEMIDIYLPKDAEHPDLRIRKIGDRLEMTKKSPLEDASKQKEHTIPLRQSEYDLLSALEGKSVEKIRYYFDYNGLRAEIDVFQGPLKGLVLVDFEFETEDEKNNFHMPDFCLADVTQEEFIAGGMVCGKSYEDIQNKLKEFGYEKIISS